MLLNLGGPESLPEVEPFLVRLFSDREIIELPLGAIAQPLFARRGGPRPRALRCGANYARIGGGSPQIRLTRAQGDGARRAPEPRGARPLPRPLAFRYWGPSTEEALAALEAQGISRVVTLTLYPHYSRATTGSSENELRRVLARPRFRDASFAVCLHLVLRDRPAVPRGPRRLACGAASSASRKSRARGWSSSSARTGCRSASWTAAIPYVQRDRGHPARRPRRASGTATATCSATSPAPGP